MNEKEKKVKAVNIFAIAFSLLVVVFIAVSASIDKAPAPAMASQIEKPLIASAVVDPVDISIETPATQSKEAVEAMPEKNKAKSDSATKVENKTESNADKVIVTVNGCDITRSQAEMRLSPIIANFAKEQQARYSKAQNDITQNTLNAMVREQLVKDAVKASSIKVSDQQVDRKLTEVAASQNITLEELLDKAAGQGTDQAQIKDQLRSAMIFEQIIEAEYGADKLTASEQDAKKYYDDNGDKFFQPLRIKASHILFGTGQRDDQGNPVAFDQSADKEFQAKAAEVLKQIKDGGSFEELARANSACVTKDKGGDLGYFGKDADIDVDFFKAASALESGQISDVIKTQFGYHIIKVDERIDEKTLSFDEAKDAIANWLSSQKRKQLTEGYINTLASKAKINWAKNQ